ncbi:MAG: hypothetical protein WBP93_23780 [Pyrinomonadaceae bacterium]
MLKGIYMTLMIGPVVPVPVPQVVLDALTSVKITINSGNRNPSAFELQFTISNNSPLQTILLLSGGAVLPLMRVMLIVTINSIPDVVIDGIITQQDITPGSAGHSTVTVKGVDMTAVMGKIDFDGIPYPCMPPEARVALIVAKYAMFGLIPLVIPSLLIDVPIPIDRIPRHIGTDLEYVYQLAEDAGYVFYINPGPVPGMNIAYWGPEIKVGVPQPALNINMDAHTNVESLNFSFNAEGSTLPILMIYPKELPVPIPIPIPAINPLSPPLGLLPPIPTNIEFLNTASLSPIQAVLKGIARASQTMDAVTASGSLDVLRYGRTLKARSLVGVRGAGMAFDGLYYVKSVTHNIKRGEYKQDFELGRNGLISTLPKVPA